jgi:short-subunit dehydrogenase
MGAALAKKLAREGLDVALVARREELLDAVCAEINHEAGEVHARPYVHDVLDVGAVPGLLRRMIADLGGLDVAIYAAGVNFSPQRDEYNTDADRSMLQANLLGAIAWLNPIAALFQSAGRGQIVGISSVAGERGRVGNPVYNASKAGLTSYLESLRNRLTRHHVNVLTVVPGFVKTDMLKAAPHALFPITAEAAAGDNWRGMRARKQQIYTPWYWREIMLVVRNIPSLIFRRLNF